jgi:hypothetical protein
MQEKGDDEKVKERNAERASVRARRALSRMIVNKTVVTQSNRQAKGGHAEHREASRVPQ